MGEIALLRDLGCYADFTMPSVPSPTQGRVINQVYWCTGTPGRPKAFDRGIEATVGGGTQGDLLMITGPLGLRYSGRLVPRMEMGEIAVNDPAHAIPGEALAGSGSARRGRHILEALHAWRSRRQRRYTAWHSNEAEWAAADIPVAA